MLFHMLEIPSSFSGVLIARDTDPVHARWSSTGCVLLMAVDMLEQQSASLCVRNGQMMGKLGHFP